MLSTPEAGLGGYPTRAIAVSGLPPSGSTAPATGRRGVGGRGLALSNQCRMELFEHELRRFSFHCEGEGEDETK